MASVTFLDSAPVIRSLVVDMTPDAVEFALSNGIEFGLDVWRSAIEGEWAPLCARVHTPAILPDLVYLEYTDGSLGTSFIETGMTLSLKVGNTQYDIEFTSGGPVADVLPQINQQTNNTVSFFMKENKPYLYVNNVYGEYSRLEVLNSGESDASVLFGLYPGLVSRGREPRPSLSLNTTRYTVRDLEYGSSVWYKWRLTDVSEMVHTTFSLPFQEIQKQPDVVSERVLAYANVVDLRGNPDPHREFFFAAEGVQNVKNSLVTDNKFSRKTDAFGRLEVYLLRGTTVRFQVAGLELVRQIKVPTDTSVTSFSLFDPAYGEDDSFAVQVKDIEWAPRRG